MAEITVRYSAVDGFRKTSKFKTLVSEKEVVSDWERYLKGWGYSDAEVKGVAERNEATLQEQAKRAAEQKRLADTADPWERMPLADKVAFERDAAKARGIDPETITPENVDEARKSRQVQEVKEKRAASKPAAPPAEKVANVVGAEVTKSASGMFRIFGYPVTAIFRFMGGAGWKHADAMTALKSLGIPGGEVSESTARIQMNAGRKGGDCGGRGPIPELSPEQAKTLDIAAGRTQPEPTPVPKKNKKVK